MQWLTNTCSCPAKGPYRYLFDAGDYNFRSTETTSEILRCQSCGSIFPKIFPTPDTLGEAYRHYYTVPKPDADEGTFRRLMNATRRDYLRRSLPGNVNRILDYGCGSGAFLVYLRQTGFQGETWGTDLFKPDPIPATVSWIEMDDLESGPTYDWITLSHVLEHLDNPRPVLKRLKRLLAPGGRIWISTPNADSFLTAATKQWSRDVDFPRHREVFSRGGLTTFLASMGLSAEFLPAPLLNGALNAVSSLKNVKQDARTSVGRVIGAVARTAGMLALSPVQRDRSPELVVLSRPD